MSVSEGTFTYDQTQRKGEWVIPSMTSESQVHALKLSGSVKLQPGTSAPQLTASLNLKMVNHSVS